MLDALKEKNKNLRFFVASDESKLFRQVNYDFSEIVEESKKLQIHDGNEYIRDDESCKNKKVVDLLYRNVFAEMPLQTGWCYGKNTKMNGMEWHKSSEVVVACTDMVLLLGDYFDIKDDRYNSSKAVALYLSCGQAVELFPLTLHLAPLPVSDYFVSAIILPQGTNMPLDGLIEKTLRAKNKWLLVHSENIMGISLGGQEGIDGNNIELIK